MKFDDVTIFGPHDENTLAQMKNVTAHDACVGATLCADGHLGYAVPIGGVIAYDGHVSPSGVGYDISCIAEGTPVLTASGVAMPIERILGHTPLSCWDGSDVRRVKGHAGHVATGVRGTITVKLSNGRALCLTPEHQIKVEGGWVAAGTLSSGDRVACPVFKGLPPSAEIDRPLGADMKDVWAAVDQATSGQWEWVHLAALARIVGVVSGDGHISADGKSVSVYTTFQEDAVALATDFRALGYDPHVYTRSRREGYRDEYHVKVGSRRLNSALIALGSPAGKKVWPKNPMPWLLGMPAWMRGQFLSGFLSAECLTPRIRDHCVIQLQVKQSGENDNGARFIARILDSLCFDTSLAESGKPRGARRDYVICILGGGGEQVRIFQEIGFCYSRSKRVAAARVASIFWQVEEHLRCRADAAERAVALRSDGMSIRGVESAVSEAFGVSPSFVNHALFSGRGAPRRQKNASFDPQTQGEVCFVPVTAITDSGHKHVYDIPTFDEAHSFIAAGVVVHNCGVRASRLDIPAKDVKARIKPIMDDIWNTISFGMGRKNKTTVDHPLFDSETWYLPAVASLKDKAREQLGTVGGGNHFVDLLADENGHTWVATHFGSRGLGHKTATYFLNAGGAKDGMMVDPLVLGADTALGHDYLRCMELAGRYAYAGRDWVVETVAGLLGAHIRETVHSHHNYCWLEKHSGRDVYVVRKGATPAFPGQRGFVGGSMGDPAYILEGIESAASAEALYSTVHGAGRAMSRTQAAGKRDFRTGEKKSEGAITKHMMLDWLKEKGVELRGADVDESPQAYKRLVEVVQYHTGTVRIVHTLNPLGVAMAGPETRDPYRD